MEEQLSFRLSCESRDSDRHEGPTYLLLIHAPTRQWPCHFTRPDFARGVAVRLPAGHRWAQAPQRLGT